jgi:phage terminase small subunit
MPRGGARPGSGRKPASKLDIPETNDPLHFLEQVMNNNSADVGARIRAAGMLADYKQKVGTGGGKKDERKRAADRAAQGKFAPALPPKLVVNNR